MQIQTVIRRLKFDKMKKSNVLYEDSFIFTAETDGSVNFYSIKVGVHFTPITYHKMFVKLMLNNYCHIQNFIFQLIIRMSLLFLN